MKKIAFVFPGQGSQSLGMLAELAQEYPQILKSFSEASEVLGYDLWDLTQNNSEKLNQTVYTQPALLAASYAIWQLWCQQSDIRPTILAGHSLGEYTALVCANSLPFTTAIKLVAERGRLMQEAVPSGVGAMAAIIGLSDEDVQKICDAAALGQIVAPANYNAIGQIVIAGHKEAVERALVLAQEKKAKMAKMLPVSVPSHCALMTGAAENLAMELAKININLPQIPVLNNVDVTVTTDVNSIKDALARQLYNPVRWVETIEYFAKENVEQIIECGPGKILAGLNKRIADIPTLSIFDPNTLKQAFDL